VEKDRKARAKIEAERRAIRFAKELKRLVNSETKYAKDKAPYIGLSFSNDIYKVSFLNSVKEIKEEGEALRHCVFSREYYKETTLLFSVTKDGEKIATAEVSVKTWRILQVRTYHNVVSPDIDPITKLITDNFKTIKDRTKPKRKSKRKLEVA